jgi:hypothetical protein
MLDAVVALSSTHSAVKLLQPLFASLIEAAVADDRASTALVSILSPASCPDQITAVALPLLIDAASAAEDATSVVLQALSVISQRDSDSYYASCDDAQKGKGAEEKSAVRKVMAAVSGVSLPCRTVGRRRLTLSISAVWLIQRGCCQRDNRRVGRCGSGSVARIQ